MTSRPRSLGDALGVRPHERGQVLAVGLLFALTEAGRVLGEVGVETQVQGRFGPTGLPNVLPYLYMALGALGVVVAVLYGAALGRLARRPLFLGVLGITAVGMVTGWIGSSSGSDAMLVGLWLGVSLAGGLLMTVSWTIAGWVFDARQARRLFPLVTAAAIAGGFAGSLAAGPLTALVGASDLVLLEALALVTAMPVVAVLARRAPAVGTVMSAPAPMPSNGRRPSALAGMRDGMGVVRDSPLLRRVAGCYVLLAVLMFSVQYPFTVSLATTLPTDAERATALGILSAAVTATSLLVSSLVAGRVYARFGVSAGAVLLPVVYLAGFATWLASFGFATAMAVRFAQQVTQRGISNASWSAFYNVVPASRRAQAIAFMDGIPGQAGMLLGGLLLLAAGRALSPDVVFWLGAGTALVTTILALGIRRGYGRSLVAALRTGAGERLLEGGPGMAGLFADPSVTRALIDALHAPEPGVREVAARLLGVSGRVDDVARHGLIAATRDPDARVRVSAIGALAAAGVATGSPTGPHPGDGPDLRTLRDDPDPRVRAAAAVAGSRGDPMAIVELASDPDATIRATALAALGHHASGWLPADVRRIVLGALHDPSDHVRTAASVALGADDRPPLDLLSELSSGSRRVVMATLDALTRWSARMGQDPTVRTAILAYADGRLRLVTRLRASRHGLATSADATLAFLVSVLLLRERSAVTTLLSALAVLGAPEASGLVRRCLGSDDPDVRAQAIEALEALGDPHLARQVAGILDDEPAEAPQARGTSGAAPARGTSVARGATERGATERGATERDATQRDATRRDATQRDAVLASLAHDDDPWLRRLAQAWLGEPAMGDATRTMTELQTMLALRRVPLFEGLDPEDLQRIATFAVERSYAPGETLMTEGDPSDELVVLLEGQVRVERATSDGTRRFIRTYAAGEHIGELAVLRERPRAATVTADAQGARGLAVAGVGLRDILRERPEAAMAMLATLAERLGRQ